MNSLKQTLFTVFFLITSLSFGSIQFLYSQEAFKYFELENADQENVNKENSDENGKHIVSEIPSQAFESNDDKLSDTLEKNEQALPAQENQGLIETETDKDNSEKEAEKTELETEQDHEENTEIKLEQEKNHTIENGEQNETPSESEEGEKTAEEQSSSENEQDSSESEKSDEEALENSELLEAKYVSYAENHFFIGAVSAIAVQAKSDDSKKVFLAGEDGYVTSFTYPSFEPDTWQLSKFKIKAIAAHPEKDYLAIYESDNLSNHTVSLWDWGKKEMLFSVKLDSQVLSLFWSALGTYLFVGNTSTSGINVFDMYGKEQDIFVTAPGIVLLAASGAREKTVLTYGETGRLLYTSLERKGLPTLFQTETKLEKPIILKNYTRLAGFKNNTVFLIDALSGKTLQTYPSKNAIFASRKSDTIPIWIEKTNERTYCIRQGNIKSPDFRFDDTITVAAHLGGLVFVGTEEGNLYTLQQKADKSISIQKITEAKFQAIKNIQGFGDKLYALTDKAIYFAKQEEQNFKVLKNILSVNIRPQRMSLCEQGIFLWSSNSKEPIYFYSFKEDRLRLFFRPKHLVRDLNCYGENCLITLQKSGLKLFNINNGKEKFSYPLDGIQSAIQVDEKNIVFAQNSFQSEELISMINIESSETLAFPISGIFSYALSSNKSNQKELYCFVIEEKNDESFTVLYKINLNTARPLESTIKKILAFKGEVLDAFIEARDKQNVNNLNTALIATNGTKYLELARSYSLAKQGTFTTKYFYALNCDGTVSVYDDDLGFINILTLTK